MTFHQTDAGAGEGGRMARTSDACTAANFRGDYTFTPAAGAKRVLHADGAGKLGSGGAFEVDGDCVVRFELTLDGKPTKWRGMLVNDGKEMPAIEIGPGEPAAACLTAR